MKRLACFLIIPLLAACAAPTEQEKRQQRKQAFNAHREACAAALPTSANRKEGLLCMAIQGDTSSQIRLSDEWLQTPKITKQECDYGAGWLMKATRSQSPEAYAKLAELYSGKALFEMGKPRTRCVTKGFYKRDMPLAYAYLLVAQELLDRQRDPKKPFSVCMPDYKLAIESWPADMTRPEIDSGKARKDFLLKQHP